MTTTDPDPRDVNIARMYLDLTEARTEIIRLKAMIANQGKVRFTEGGVAVQHWAILDLVESLAESLKESPNFLVVDAVSPSVGRISVTLQKIPGKSPSEVIGEMRAENEKLIDAFIWTITDSARSRHPEYYEGAHCEAAVPGLDPETDDFIVLESRFASADEARAAIRKAAGIGEKGDLANADETR